MPNASTRRRRNDVRSVAVTAASVTVALLLQSGAGASGGGDNEVRLPVSDLEKATFEATLESRLRRDIQSYLNHERFIVDVDASLIKVVRNPPATATATASQLGAQQALPAPQAAPGQPIVMPMGASSGAYGAPPQPAPTATTTTTTTTDSEQRSSEQWDDAQAGDAGDTGEIDDLQPGDSEDIALPGLPVSERRFQRSRASAGSTRGTAGSKTSKGGSTVTRQTIEQQQTTAPQQMQQPMMQQPMMPGTMMQQPMMQQPMMPGTMMQQPMWQQPMWQQPMMPGTMMQPGATAYPSPDAAATAPSSAPTDARISVEQLRVRLILDDTSTAEQQQFLRGLVAEKANISEVRGDTLAVSTAVFPNRSLDDPAAAMQVPTLREVLLYWPQIAAVTMAALFLLLLIWAMRRDTRNHAGEALLAQRLWAGANQAVAVPSMQQPASAGAAPGGGGKTAHDAIPAATSGAATTPTPALDHESPAAMRSALASFREDLVAMAVVDPAPLETLTQQWSKSTNDDDKVKLHALYGLCGHTLFRRVLAEKLTPQVVMELSHPETPLEALKDPKTRLDIVESVHREIMRLHHERRRETTQRSKPFEFVEALDDDQILYLLNDEDVRIQAVLFSQLRAQRAGKLLNRLKEPVQTQIAVMISRIQQLPIQAFRDIGNRLARKAIDVPSFQNIEVDGVELLADMFDYMSPPQERALMARLQQDNPDFYYRIKAIRVSFAELPALPKDGLRNLLKEIEREQLALALYGTDDDLRGALLGVLAERPRAMLASAISTLTDAQPEAVDEARRTIVRRVREMLRAGEIRRPDAGDVNAAPAQAQAPAPAPAQTQAQAGAAARSMPAAAPATPAENAASPHSRAKNKPRKRVTIAAPRAPGATAARNTNPAIPTPRRDDTRG